MRSLLPYPILSFLYFCSLQKNALSYRNFYFSESNIIVSEPYDAPTKRFFLNHQHYSNVQSVSNMLISVSMSPKFAIHTSFSMFCCPICWIPTNYFWSLKWYLMLDLIHATWDRYLLFTCKYARLIYPLLPPLHPHQFLPWSRQSWCLCWKPLILLFLALYFSIFTLLLPNYFFSDFALDAL